MKLQGKKIEGPNVEVIIIPRGDGKDIIFKAEAIRDFDDFEKLCPEPKPPQIKLASGEDIFDVEDPVFKKQMDRFGDFKIAWMIIKSLSATEGLEWETVKLSNRLTWLQYKDELLQSGFSIFEVNKIINGVMAANGMSETRMAEARKRFLATQRAQADQSSSQKDDLNSTQPGEPANA